MLFNPSVAFISLATWRDILSVPTYSTLIFALCRTYFGWHFGNISPHRRTALLPCLLQPLPTSDLLNTVIALGLERRTPAAEEQYSLWEDGSDTAIRTSTSTSTSTSSSTRTTGTITSAAAVRTTACWLYQQISLCVEGLRYAFNKNSDYSTNTSIRSGTSSSSSSSSSNRKNQNEELSPVIENQTRMSVGTASWSTLSCPANEDDDDDGGGGGDDDKRREDGIRISVFAGNQDIFALPHEDIQALIIRKFAAATSNATATSNTAFTSNATPLAASFTADLPAAVARAKSSPLLLPHDCSEEIASIDICMVPHYEHMDTLWADDAAEQIFSRI